MKKPKRRSTRTGRRLLALLLAATAGVHAHAAEGDKDRTAMIVAVGAAGEDQYADTFAKWAANWQRAAAAGDARITTIGAAADENESLSRLKQLLEAEPKESPAPLWLVLLGHGTFDGREGKFNLRGDDLAASELAKWLAPFKRPVVLICGFSASGAFLKPLAGADRVVIVATKSGSESNFARFGGHISEAISDPAADLDKDKQTSVLEAWIFAAERVADFYKSEGRLATEHSLLDDNGDGLGTPADWFSGVRLVKKSADQRVPDGLRAHQLHLIPSAAERALPAAVRAERDQLERELSALRDAKAATPEDDYYRRLEELLLRIGRLYRDGAGSGS